MKSNEILYVLLFEFISVISSANQNKSDRQYQFCQILWFHLAIVQLENWVYIRTHR
jgi:hypothetical protein